MANASSRVQSLVVDWEHFSPVSPTPPPFPSPSPVARKQEEVTFKHSNDSPQPFLACCFDASLQRAPVWLRSGIPSAKWPPAWWRGGFGQRQSEEEAQGCGWEDLPFSDSYSFASSLTPVQGSLLRPRSLARVRGPCLTTSLLPKAGRLLYSCHWGKPVGTRWCCFENICWKSTALRQLVKGQPWSDYATESHNQLISYRDQSNRESKQTAWHS